MRAAGGIWLILVAAVALATCKDEGPSCSLSGTLTYLGTGGRESQTAKKSDGSIAWTNLDADGLRVELLPS